MGDYYIAPRGILSTEAVIDRKELARLRELAMIGQAYEAAMQTMRNRQAHFQAMLDDPGMEGEPTEGRTYKAGWMNATNEFADEVRRERDARAVATTEAGRHPDL